MDERIQPPVHADLVDALLEPATATTRALDDLTKAPDVPDRRAALEHLRHAYYDLLAPISLLLGTRDVRTTTAVIEAASNIVIGSFDFAPCEVAAPARPDPRAQHRARPRRPRQRGVRQ